MPWQTKFNVDDAISQATLVFWAKGYQATSLADLLEAMKIKKGSFYNTFESKKALFIKVLDNYDSIYCRGFIEQIEKINEPNLALESLFDLIIEQSLNDLDKKGCLIVNTAQNLPNHDAEASEVVFKTLAYIEKHITKIINNGIETGVFKKDTIVRDATKSIIANITSLRILARGVFQENDLIAIKSQAMKALIH